MTFAEIVSHRIVPIADSIIIPLFYALAFLFFLIGMARYFFSQEEGQHTKGREFALWSVIAFAVLFSVWGLVRLLLSVIMW